MIRALLFLATLLAVPCLVSADSTGKSVGVTKDFLQFKLTLPREQYVEGEPIIATLTLTNASDKPQRLAEPNSRTDIAGCVLQQIYSEEPMPPRLSSNQLYPPAEVAGTFKPGEERCAYVDLQAYSDLLPIGDYSVAAKYWGPEKIDGIWHGRISTSEIRFSIAAASESEKATAEAYRDARRVIYHAYNQDEVRTAIETMKLLSDPAKGGRYKQCAAYWAAIGYTQIKDTEKACRALQGFVLEHKDAQVYWTDAVFRLARLFAQKEKMDEARKTLNLLPDCYVRRRETMRLENVENSKKKTNNAVVQ